MAFTKYHYDDVRINKQYQESIYECSYQLNTPQINVSYINNPEIRLQRWGNNLRTNSCNIESNLRGLSQRLDRDNSKNEMCVNLNKLKQSNETFNISDTLRTHPAWKYREKQMYRCNVLLDDPQRHAIEPFDRNLNITQHHKDLFKNKNKNKM